MRSAAFALLICVCACGSLRTHRPIAALLFQPELAEPVSVVFHDGQAFSSARDGIRACEVSPQTVERLARMADAPEFLALPPVHVDPSCCDAAVMTIVTPDARRTVISSGFNGAGGPRGHPAGEGVPRPFAVLFDELHAICARGTPWQPSAVEVELRPITYPCKPGCNWPEEFGRVDGKPIRLSLAQSARISAECPSVCARGRAYVPRIRPVWPGEELWQP